VITVGFDLDMTLIDSRPGIAATYDALSAETGVAVDSALVVSRLGPPLADELANWYPADEVDAVADRYRELYPGIAVQSAPLLPGVREAIAAIREHGGIALVVTGKFAANARLHLDHLELVVDAVYGNLWAEAKAGPLIEHRADVYVGDHVADIRAAKAAGALALMVTTGSCTEDELYEAGADVVLRDLTEFPAWLDAHLRADRAAS
jgi:phosphoglycolate phosphatase